MTDLPFSLAFIVDSADRHRPQKVVMVAPLEEMAVILDAFSHHGQSPDPIRRPSA